MKKEEEFQVARDGEVIGSFSYHTASSRASFGTLRPSDYACITKRGKLIWIHLYKVLEIFASEFFDELGESELEKELKTETERVKELLKLYKKAFDNETDKKKLNEYCVRVVEYERLLEHLGGIKERIFRNKAEEEAEEKKEREEQQKELEVEIGLEVNDVIATLKEMIEEAKIQPLHLRGLPPLDEIVTLRDLCFDWYWDYKDVLPQFCKSEVDEETAKALWKAFRKIKLYKGELTALARRLVKAKKNTDADKGGKEAKRIFFAFLVEKGVWAK